MIPPPRPSGAFCTRKSCGRPVPMCPPDPYGRRFCSADCRLVHAAVEALPPARTTSMMSDGHTAAACVPLAWSWLDARAAS